MAFPIVEAIFCKHVVQGGMAVGAIVGTPIALSVWSEAGPKRRFERRVEKTKFRIFEEEQVKKREELLKKRGIPIESYVHPTSEEIVAETTMNNAATTNGADGNPPATDSNKNLFVEIHLEVERSVRYSSITIPPERLPPGLTKEEMCHSAIQATVWATMAWLGIFSLATGFAYIAQWRIKSYLASRLLVGEGSARDDEAHKQKDNLHNSIATAEIEGSVILKRLQEDEWFSTKMGIQIPTELAVGFASLYFGVGMLAVFTLELFSRRRKTVVGLGGGEKSKMMTPMLDAFKELGVLVAGTLFLVVPSAVVFPAPVTWPIGIMCSKAAVEEATRELKQLQQPHRE